MILFSAGLESSAINNLLKCLQLGILQDTSDSKFLTSLFCFFFQTTEYFVFWLKSHLNTSIIYEAVILWYQSHSSCKGLSHAQSKQESHVNACLWHELEPEHCAGRISWFWAVDLHALLINSSSLNTVSLLSGSLWCEPENYSTWIKGHRQGCSHHTGNATTSASWGQHVRSSALLARHRSNNLPCSLCKSSAGWPVITAGCGWSVKSHRRG